MLSIEEKYDNLLRKYQRLESEHEKLKGRYDKQYDELQHQTFRVEQELEPRIRSEKRGYDNWATDPER